MDRNARNITVWAFLYVSRMSYDAQRSTYTLLCYYIANHISREEAKDRIVAWGHAQFPGEHEWEFVQTARDRNRSRYTPHCVWFTARCTLRKHEPERR